MTNTPDHRPHSTDAPDSPADTARTAHDSPPSRDSTSDGGGRLGATSQGNAVTVVSSKWNQALGWGGSLIAGAGLVLTDPLGLLGAAGIVAFFTLAPTGVGQLLAFAFGQIAVAAILPVGTDTFIIVELALYALALSSVPVSNDRPSRVSLGIGVITLSLAAGSVWLAVTAGFELLSVALGLGLGGAILLYRVQRYEHIVITGLER